MASYEGVVIAGMYAPPFGDFSDEEIERQCAAIEAASPDIVWVGLGAPKQELWMARVRSQISAPVLIGVGAVFDFVSGTRRRAPRWMQCLGLEWSYRLGQEPKRLWRRYLKTNTSFVVATVWSALRGEVAA
jgi:N-acetylglucosaminyldiphosphoundecaprenol N-acetyl-beta-D-mannosaminyltransferase